VVAASRHPARRSRRDDVGQHVSEEVLAEGVDPADQRVGQEEVVDWLTPPCQPAAPLPLTPLASLDPRRRPGRLNANLVGPVELVAEYHWRPRAQRCGRRVRSRGTRAVRIPRRHSSTATLPRMIHCHFGLVEFRPRASSDQLRPEAHVPTSGSIDHRRARIAHLSGCHPDATRARHADASCSPHRP
jgi:hypothetical protein